MDEQDDADADRDAFVRWLEMAIAPLGSPKGSRRPRDHQAARAAARALGHGTTLADVRRELEDALAAVEARRPAALDGWILTGRPARRRRAVVARLEAVANDAGAPAVVRQAARLAAAGLSNEAAARVVGEVTGPAAAVLRDVADGLHAEDDAIARALREALDELDAPAAADRDVKPNILRRARPRRQRVQRRRSRGRAARRDGAEPVAREGSPRAQPPAAGSRSASLRSHPEVVPHLRAPLMSPLDVFVIDREVHPAEDDECRNEE
jgi:hypothetical protein